MALDNWRGRDPESFGFKADVAAKVLLFSRLEEVSDGACLEEGSVVVRRSGRTQKVLPVDQVPLVGIHNLENVLAEHPILPFVTEHGAVVVRYGHFEQVTEGHPQVAPAVIVPKIGHSKHAARLLSRPLARFVGDMAALGKGEIFFPA